MLVCTCGFNAPASRYQCEEQDAGGHDVAANFLSLVSWFECNKNTTSGGILREVQTQFTRQRAAKIQTLLLLDKESVLSQAQLHACLLAPNVADGLAPTTALRHVGQLGVSLDCILFRSRYDKETYSRSLHCFSSLLLQAAKILLIASTCSVVRLLGNFTFILIRISPVSEGTPCLGIPSPAIVLVV